MNPSMDKFIITQKMRKSNGYASVNIRADVKMLVDEISENTGVSVGRIVAAMILFCVDRLVIEKEEPEDAQNESRKKQAAD
jgi:hypothetical protein